MTKTIYSERLIKVVIARSEWFDRLTMIGMP